MLVAVGAIAQVDYTDVNPDAVINTSGGAFLLNLNNDATNDFKIEMYYGSTSSGLSQGNVIFSAYSSNQVAFTYSAGISSLYNVVLDMSTNSLINSSLSWRSNANLAGFSIYGTYAYYAGQWMGAGDKYAGLTISIGANTYYGWCRVNVSSDGKMVTIKDYAYETTPNTPIYAGNVNSYTTIENEGDNRLDIIARDSGLVIESNDNQPVQKIEILSLSGESVFSMDNPAVNELIPISKLATGVYIATAYTLGAPITIKLYLTNND